MDWGKHLYEQSQRAKESKKKQTQIIVKEMKFRPKIDTHDYETKKRHVVRFLEDGAKVKVTIMFRGREMTHTELGARILDKLAEDLEDLAAVEAAPKLDGRNMIMVLAPTRKESHDQTTTRKPRGKRKGKGKRRQQQAEAAVAAAEHTPASEPDSEADDVAADEQAVAAAAISEAVEDAAEAIEDVADAAEGGEPVDGLAADAEESA